MLPQRRLKIAVWDRRRHSRTRCLTPIAFSAWLLPGKPGIPVLCALDWAPETPCRCWGETAP